MADIGLVLSGGGARDVAHLGMLQALDELQIKPQVISGVSAGAVIGALYAGGYKPAQILHMAKEHSPMSVVAAVITAGGLFSPEVLKDVLAEALPHDGFEFLKIPLYVTATDLNSCSSVFFSKGLLNDVIVGSAAVPAVFEPILHQHYLLVDGGVLNDFPVDCLSGQCRKIIGSHIINY